MDEMNRYFDYLCGVVGRSQEYGLLLETLHNIQFYSLIPNDDNRGADGEHLRSVFLDEVGQTWSTSLPKRSCTMLEMLIGLSIRLEFETFQSQWEKTPQEWFWILIDNLGLLDCTDDSYINQYSTHQKIIDVCETVNRRLYNANGEGGLFPLRNPKKDQRRVEIWYQMTAYMIENYPI